MGTQGPRRVAMAVLVLAGVGAFGGGIIQVDAADRRGREWKRGEDFHWSWRIPSGRMIEIKGVNGAIRARATSGHEVEVIARKSARRSDPDEVKIEVLEHRDGVTVCAVYPGRRGKPNECEAGGGGRMNTHDSDVQVDFDLRVPVGVRFVARSVNGGIAAEDLSAPVEAHTVNGSVRLSTTDVARAHTVNGSITASIGSAGRDDRLSFRTVNGSITVNLPEDLDADVEVETVNGNIRTDFPMTVSGKISRRRVSGTIGRGRGASLQCATVNGNVRLLASR